MRPPHIIWSPVAEDSYLKTIEYILAKWSLREAEKFESKVNHLLNKLMVHQKLCPESISFNGLRKCVISSQTSLIYRVHKNSIELIAFIDNRSNQTI
ncbi:MULTISPECIES: type II toxin-antitoxin system RelE/ParE family toxin [unclassified Lentimicrobium]|uniref:type II toxin-antitoxin system RelE/ParE family toxin n=1 Tax=unclassified Lentimicrobium TaxID=2677434 RepID=UPI00155686D4|nr:MULTISPECIES: type II toxin-antitoxin system RelE/ParE family toxin [unclassified Lentimicrobium]NPD46018.1 type II toxin-antitoxin system RelE/ParE family toxin [Lentimicrobium sp. S6]NPD85218.1 type II toxin-antitoxin system RelE/ParE family toxin [Lentimicrobium sp. L6]